MTTKALVFKTLGDPATVLSLNEVILPALESAQIHLKLLAAPVTFFFDLRQINPADVLQIQGKYGNQPSFDLQDGLAVGGNEGVFQVAKVGPDVKDLHVGDW